MIDKEGRRIVIDPSSGPPATGERLRTLVWIGQNSPAIVRATVLTMCGLKAATQAAIEHERTKLHGLALGLTDEQIRSVIEDSDLYSWEDIRSRLTLLAMNRESP